ncbi:MAG TPA: ATP-binding cassette domain-containing protein [Vicinamibacterales bacterium]
MALVTPAASTHSPADATVPPVVVFEGVGLAFDEKVVLKNVSFELKPAHTKVILGGSGSGKSTILKLILGFLKPDAGSIWINGQRIDTMSEPDLMRVRDGIGMVFQEGALFDSLTVEENVGYRLYDETDTPFDRARARVDEVLGFIGLSEFTDRMPSALSGGQRRRVAIARAIASKPGLILYDEATTGLDPMLATTVDQEMVKLRDLEGVTSVIVTHQLRDAFFVATHAARRVNGRTEVVAADERKAEEAEFLMLRDGVVAFEGSASELRASRDPYIRDFLS